MRKAFSVFCLLGLMLISALAPAQAQVSLGATDQTDVVVKVDGVDEAFTVLRDYARPEQFYYVPNRPHLATRGSGDKKRPVFHLLKYQSLNQATNELVDAGVLQFSVRLAPPEGVVNEMRKQVASQFSLEEAKIKLSPLPFKSAEIAIYDLDGELVTTAFQKPGIAPAFANSEVPFQVQLTSLSADIYDSLTSGSGGIPVYITYTFDTVSPVTGFKVTVDWDQSFSHFSKDERTKQAYTRWYYYRTWWGGWRGRGETGQRETQEQTLSEVLTENKSISYESVGMTPEQITKYLDPVIERVSREMVERITPPEKIEPAAAKEPNSAWWGTNSTYAMKNANKVKKGTEVIEMKNRDLSESKSTYGSLLGIGQYDKNIIEKSITIMPAGNWNYAYFPVPAVGDKQALAIKKIDLQVIPRFYDKNGKAQQIPGTIAQLATWKPEDGFFSDRRGNEVTNLLFPMQAITDYLAKQQIPLASCTYEVVTTVTQGSDIMKFASFEEFIMGGVPVSNPMALLEGLEIDCDPLTFAKDGLYMVKMEIKPTYPRKTYRTTVKGDSAVKNPVFLVEKEDEGKKNGIIANINFILNGGKQIPWKHNGRNLQDSDLGLTVTLWDTDYKPENSEEKKSN